MLGKQTRSGDRQRAPLNRERVLQAAIQLSDEGGLETLTMRRLAEKLGVEAMSLYYHVSNKDDILDVEGETEVIGKQSGADERLGKATYPGLAGIEEARARCNSLLRSALEQLDETVKTDRHRDGQPDGGPARVTTADPVPEPEYISLINAEFPDRGKVGGYGRKVSTDMLLAAGSVYEPLPGCARIGHGLLGRE